MSQIPTKEKDPNEILDYTIDWNNVLQSGEEIAESVWSTPGSVEIGEGEYEPTSGAKTATIWLLGGTVGSIDKITNQITTTSTPPRVFEYSFSVRIRDK